MTAITLGPGTLVTLPAAITGLLAIVLIYRIILYVYRLHFHPLAKFPGPKLYAASYFPYLFQDKIQGSFAKGVLKLHEKYGPIVRVSPNRLAIDGSIGWSEVFAHRGSRPEFHKTIEIYGLDKRVGLFPADKEDHRRQRRLLSHAFSTAALQEQEKYLKFYIDLLMQRLRENMQEGKAVDITRWYNFTTFDIIGELAFADSFYSLAKSDYHPWVAMIFASIKANALVAFMMHYPLLRPFVVLLIGKDGIRKREEFNEMARSKTEKRLQLGNDETRKDFITYVLRHNTDGKGMTHEEIITNSRGLIGAGSETTATALSGLTFHLGQNPTVLDRLSKEIRMTFSSEEEINMKSTAQLPYLQACLEETLRIYPPAAETPPRVSPGEYVNGQYIPEGTYITIYQWATHHSPRNFTDPDKFAPERWLPTTHPMYDIRYLEDNKAACKPFSAGPRDCIGKNLAYAEMRLIVARLLWNFDFELVPGQNNWLSNQAVFIVHEKGPLMVRLKSATRD